MGYMNTTNDKNTLDCQGIQSNSDVGKCDFVAYSKSIDNYFNNVSSEQLGKDMQDAGYEFYKNIDVIKYVVRGWNYDKKRWRVCKGR